MQVQFDHTQVKNITDRYDSCLKRSRLNRMVYFEEDKCLNDRTAYAESGATCQDLLFLRNAVQCFLDAIDKNISAVRAAVMPASRHYGLMDLPNEILTRILDAVGGLSPCYRYDYLPRRDRGNLSLVSKRFNQCARAATMLWDVPRDAQSLTAVERPPLLNTDGTQIKKVVLHAPGPANVLSTLPQLMYLLLHIPIRADEWVPIFRSPPKSRPRQAILLPCLQSLDVIFEDKGYVDVNSDKIALSWFQLPGLKALRIAYKKSMDCINQEWEDIDIDNLLYKFLNLRQQPIYTSVRVLELCDFIDDTYREWRSWEIELSSILEAFPNIDALALQAWQWVKYCVTPPDLGSSRISLPNLRHLHLETDAVIYQSQQPLTAVIRGLQDVHKAHIESVSVRSGDNFFAWVRECFPEAVKTVRAASRTVFDHGGRRTVK